MTVLKHVYWMDHGLYVVHDSHRGKATEQRNVDLSGLRRRIECDDAALPTEVARIAPMD